MRFFLAGAICLLGTMLIGPVSGRAPDSLEQRTRNDPMTSAVFLTGPAAGAATPLFVNGTDRKASNPPPERDDGIARSFERFGHSVAGGAKSVGRAVEGGAKKFGRSVTEGWNSFKRSLNGP